MKNKAAITADSLARCCDGSELDFDSTDEVAEFTGILGQARALEAIRFGLAGRRAGYNLFVHGPNGIGKHSAVLRLLEQQAAAAAVPVDICYVANFEALNRPRLLRLPAGRGVLLRQDMQHLVEELAGSLPAALESEEYQARVRQIEQRFDKRQADAIDALRAKAQQQQVQLYEQPGEFSFTPVHDGQELDMNAFSALPAADKQAIEAKVSALQEELTQILDEQVPQWQKQRRDALRGLHRDSTRVVVQRTLLSLRERYADLPVVSAYLESVEQAVIHNTHDFLGHESAEAQVIGDLDLFRHYRVNLLVDHSASRGAPVIFEDNPTYAALIGRIEHQTQNGALVTDFNLICAGALHKANGGYLVIDARKLLQQPYAWDGLKRALRAGEIRIESLGQAESLIATVSLEPEPLRLDVQVILEGDSSVYYLLQAQDQDFNELFKVAANFEDVIERNPHNTRHYAQLLATLVRREGLRAFDRAAIAAVIDHSARLAEDTLKLSTRMRDIVDLLQEADFHAAEAGRERVTDVDIQRAIQARNSRAGRVQERLLEDIRRGIHSITLEGRALGQINGLTVTDVGDFSFGLPIRITATTRLGEGEVIDIEREVEMGGPIHSKGVFILASFLGARYARSFPLSLSASLAFEQSYTGVEGDSASLAELCALLSSLAGVKLEQSLAVTGAVDQQGRVQAVGGINEKVEGFFDVCAQAGLNGRHGVILPRANVQHLLLRPDVVEAVRGGRFHVYAVEDVDTAMAVLSGLSAGRLRSSGLFPPKSINGRVQQCLADFAQLHVAFAAAPREVPPEDKKGASKAVKKPAKG